MTTPAPALTHVSTINPMPIYCKHGHNHIFLEVIPRDDGKIRVKITELGAKTLGRYWNAWLRHLVLHKTDAKHMYAVEMRDGDLIISLAKSYYGLVATVIGLASDIRPLLIKPLKPYIRAFGRSAAREWRIVRPHDLQHTLDEIIAGIKLPKGAQVSYIDHKHASDSHDYAHIALIRKPECIMSSRDLGLIVESTISLSPVVRDSWRRLMSLSRGAPHTTIIISSLTSQLLDSHLLFWYNYLDFVINLRSYHVTRQSRWFIKEHPQ